MMGGLEKTLQRGRELNEIRNQGERMILRINKGGDLKGENNDGDQRRER